MTCYHSSSSVLVVAEILIMLSLLINCDVKSLQINSRCVSLPLLLEFTGCLVWSLHLGIPGQEKSEPSFCVA